MVVIASPTEAAAVAAVYAYFIAVFGYRDIGPLKHIQWRNTKNHSVKPLLAMLC